MRASLFLVSLTLLLTSSVLTGQIKFDGNWGNWQTAQGISQDFYLCGAEMRFQQSQGGGDDTATNGFIFTFCNLMNWEDRKTLRWDGDWGSWRGLVMCPTYYFVNGMQVRFQSSQGGGDDTAFNGLRLSCRSFDNKQQVISVYEGRWGNWREWQKTSTRNQFINGFKVRYEGQQGRGDDTALNGLSLLTTQLQVRKLLIIHKIPDNYHLNPKVIASKSIRNGISSPIKQSVTLSGQVKNTRKWQNNLKYLHEQEIKSVSGIPKITGQSPRTMKLELVEEQKKIKFGVQQTQQANTSQTIELECPPCKTCTIKLMVQEIRLDMPYRIDIDYRTGLFKQYSGIFSGALMSQTYTEVQFQRILLCQRSIADNIATAAQDSKSN